MNLSRLAAVIETVAEQDAITAPPRVMVALEASSHVEAERIACALADTLNGNLRDCSDSDDDPRYTIRLNHGQDVRIEVGFPLVSALDRKIAAGDIIVAAPGGDAS